MYICISSISFLLSILYLMGIIISMQEEDLIMKGSNVPAGKYPFMIMGNGCGGSLISSDTFLTAAHCDESFVGNAWIDRVTWSGGRTLKITQKWKHPGGEGSDVMVVKFTPPITNVKPVYLDTGKKSYSVPGTVNTVIGWGDINPAADYVVPEILQEVSLKIITQDECKNLCNNGWWPYDTEICMKVENGKATGGGDSGSPMFYQKDGIFVQTGIVHGSSECGKYGIYARVSKFVDWILKYSPNSKTIEYIGKDDNIGGEKVPTPPSEVGGSEKCKIGEKMQNKYLRDYACQDIKKYKDSYSAMKACCSCKECGGFTGNNGAFTIRKGKTGLPSYSGETSYLINRDQGHPIGDKCTYGTKKTNMYLTGYACGDSRQYLNKSEAEKMCCACNSCSGITSGFGMYTIRTSSTLLKSSYSENSWMKN